MYEDIMRRPMFQNSQQRAGSGIMAGVAPVQGYDDGGSVPQYTPKFLREEEEGLLDQVKGQFEKTPEGSGVNLRDFTDFFIVDPNDEYDVAMAAATAGLIGMPPAAATVALARMGYKGKKLYDKINKLKTLQDRMRTPKEGIGSVMAARELEDAVEDPTQFSEDYYDIGRDVAETGKMLYDNREDLARMGLEELKDSEVLQQEDMIGPFSDFKGMADGGIATLPMYMDDGGDANKSKKRIGLGISALKKELEKLLKKKEIGKKEAEDTFEDLTGERADFSDLDSPTKLRRDKERRPKLKTKAQKKAEADSKRTGPSKETKEDLRGKPEEPTPPVSNAAKADDVGASQEAAADAIFDEKGGKGFLNRNKGKIATGVLTAPITVPGTLGIVDEFAGTDMARPVREVMPTMGEIAESIGEFGGRTVKGFREGVGSEEEDEVVDDDFVGPPLPPDYLALSDDERKFRREMLQQQSQPKPDVPASVGKEQVEEERSKVMPSVRPFGGKIARALLGEDEAFGGDDEKDQGFLGSVMSKLQDPRVQYQLAKAGQATEGFVPRNFGSDVTLAGEEYDDAVAKRDYLAAQTRDVDRTDTEKLVDYYIDSLKEADPSMTFEDAAEKRLKLNSLFQRQGASAAEMTTLLTIFDNVANADQANAILKKFNVDPNLPQMISQILSGTD